MEGSGSNVGVERVATEQVIEGEATRNVLEKQLIRWAKRGDTTPSVLNVERLQFRNTTPVTVVAFDDGKPGQSIHVLGDGQTTVNHNAKILRAGGASAVLVDDADYNFTMWEDRVWHESQASGGGGGGGGGVTSFAGRAGVVVPVAADYTPAFIGAVPSTHLTDADPHTQYVLDSEKGASGGVAQLDGSTLVPKAQLGAGVADATKFLRGDGTWAVAGVAGSGTYAVFDDEIPPAAPSALDDEFDAPGLNVKWTQVQWAGLTAFDVDTTMPCELWLSNRSGAVTPRYILQALPAGDFSIFTKLRHLPVTASFGYAALALTTGVTVGAGNQLLHSLTQEGGGYNRYVQTAINFASMSGTLFGPGAWAGGPEIILRIKRVGAVYTFGWSINGRVWVDSVLAPGFVPTHCGIASFTSGGSTNLETTHKYFRYFPSGVATLGGKQLKSKV